MRLSLLASLIVAAVMVGLTPGLAGADQRTANESTHVLRVKRDRENRSIHFVQLDGIVIRDFASFRQQIESIPAGAVLSWRSPAMFSRVVLEDCHWPIDDLKAFCRERGVITDFVFGCNF